MYRELKRGLDLDHFKGRSWPGWHHHVIPVAAARAFLTEQRLSPEAPESGSPSTRPSPPPEHPEVVDRHLCQQPLPNKTSQIQTDPTESQWGPALQGLSQTATRSRVRLRGGDGLTPRVAPPSRCGMRTGLGEGAVLQGSFEYQPVTVRRCSRSAWRLRQLIMYPNIRLYTILCGLLRSRNGHQDSIHRR